MPLIHARDMDAMVMDFNARLTRILAIRLDRVQAALLAEKPVVLALECFLFFMRQAWSAFFLEMDRDFRIAFDPDSLFIGVNNLFTRSGNVLVSWLWSTSRADTRDDPQAARFKDVKAGCPPPRFEMFRSRIDFERLFQCKAEDLAWRVFPTIFCQHVIVR